MCHTILHTNDNHFALDFYSSIKNRFEYLVFIKRLSLFKDSYKSGEVSREAISFGKITDSMIRKIGDNFDIPLYTPYTLTRLKLTYKKNKKLHLLNGWHTSPGRNSQSLSMAFTTAKQELFEPKDTPICVTFTTIKAGYHASLIPLVGNLDFRSDTEKIFIITHINDVLFFDGQDVSLKKFIIPDFAGIEKLSELLPSYKPIIDNNIILAKMLTAKRKIILQPQERSKENG